MSFSESDFVATKASGAQFVKAEPYVWADVKHVTIPFKSSPYKGQSLEQIVMQGGRDGIKHLRRLSRWSDEFIDGELRDQVRVAIKFRAAYEKWLEKQGASVFNGETNVMIENAPKSREQVVDAAITLPPLQALDAMGKQNAAEYYREKAAEPVKEQPKKKRSYKKRASKKRKKLDVVEMECTDDVCKPKRKAGVLDAYGIAGMH